MRIAVGIEQGLSNREIGELIERDRTVVWRERGRNSVKARGYQPVSAQTKARKRRARPQERLIDVDPVLSARGPSGSEAVVSDSAADRGTVTARGRGRKR